VPVIGDYRFDICHRRVKAGLQALQTEGGKGGVALEAKNVGHGEEILGQAERPALYPRVGGYRSLADGMVLAAKRGAAREALALKFPMT